MKFHRNNKSLMVGEDFIKIHLRYFEDGTFEALTTHKNKGRWKISSQSYGHVIPTWDELHEWSYKNIGKVFRVIPEPLFTVIAHMKYFLHCLEIKRNRHDT